MPVQKGHKFGPQSPEHIAKRFAAGAGARSGVKQTAAHVKAAADARRGRKRTYSSIKAEQLRQRWADGLYDGLFQRQARFIYNGIGMRSNWERLAAAHFDEIGLEWQYEPRRFVLPSRRHYYPDFHLPQVDLWVEVKGFATYVAASKFDEFVGLGYSAVWVTGQSDAEFLEELKAQVREVTV